MSDKRLEMLEFLIVVRDHREDTREYLIDNGFSPKVIYVKALKAARRGYTDYGVVADRPRLTAKGRNFIERALEQT